MKPMQAYLQRKMFAKCLKYNKGYNFKISAKNNFRVYFKDIILLSSRTLPLKLKPYFALCNKVLGFNFIKFY
jgi:hypothetical protein